MAAPVNKGGDLTAPLHEQMDDIKPLQPDDGHLRVNGKSEAQSPQSRKHKRHIRDIFGQQLAESPSPPPPAAAAAPARSPAPQQEKAKKKNRVPAKFTLSPRASRRKRMNGFEAPYHWQQVMSWVLHPLLLVLYVLLIHPWINFSPHDEAAALKWKTVLTFIYVPLWAILFILGYLATITNPEDPYVKGRFISKDDFNVDSVTRMQQTICYEENQDWCDFCVWMVQSSSYHCQACNKCTAKMDHHCPIYNNCVGAANYPYFITSLISAFVLMLLYVSCTCVVIWNVANDVVEVPIHFVFFIAIQIMSVVLYWAPMVYVLYLLGLFTYLNIKQTSYVDEMHLKPLDATREFSRRDHTSDMHLIKQALSGTSSTLSLPVQGGAATAAAQEAAAKAAMNEEKLDLVPSCTDVFARKRTVVFAGEVSTTELSGVAIERS